MDQNQALNVLVQAARVAQKRGAFSLDEASAVARAVSAFVATEPAASTSEETEEEAEE